MSTVEQRMYNRDRMRAWRAANPKIYTDEDRQRDRAYRVKVRRTLKANVINTLGGKCACCQESKLEFLCVDHRNGGGRKHRAELRGSYRIYYWLQRQIKNLGVRAVKRQFRVLCWNCNSAYGLFGYCPHRKGVVRA